MPVPDMPVCRCHTFDSIETPILSHVEIWELVTVTALEFLPIHTDRTETERRVIQDRIMKLQEDFLRRIAERLQVYKQVLMTEWRTSERHWQKFE